MSYQSEAVRRAKQVKAEKPDYDRDAYNRGWRASGRAGAVAPLDAADFRGEPDEWYDGYFDRANDRFKWHDALCDWRNCMGECEGK